MNWDALGRLAKNAGNAVAGSMKDGLNQAQNYRDKASNYSDEELRRKAKNASSSWERMGYMAAYNDRHSEDDD